MTKKRLSIFFVFLFIGIGLWYQFIYRSDGMALRSHENYLFPSLSSTDQVHDSLTKTKEFLTFTQITQSIPFYPIEQSQNFKINHVDIELKRYFAPTLSISKNSVMNAVGSSYLEYHNETLYVVTGGGVISYIKLNKVTNRPFSAKLISSNLQDIVRFKDFYYTSFYGIKDVLIHEQKIYISLTHERRKGCFTTAVFVADLNHKHLTFEPLFLPDECLTVDNDYGEFNAHQSGGRMIAFKDNSILLTVGDYRVRSNAQYTSSIFGKVISIDISSREYHIISMGHRDQQGLVYDAKNDVLIHTDHGPQGGDEINFHFNPNKIPTDELPNYGWPVASYGEHYGFKKRKPKHPKYVKAPLYKSHKQYGFIEPIFYLVPSVGITEIIQLDETFMKPDNPDNGFLFAAMGKEFVDGKQSLHHIVFDSDYKSVKSHTVLPIGERVRDMIYIADKQMIVVFLESLPSLGIITLE